MTALVLPHTLIGDSQGTPIIMVHPLGGDRSFWLACSKLLGPGVMGVACDLRGSGEAPLPDGPPTPAQHVADIEVLRRYLGLSRVVVAGCAVGSMVAALYTATHAEQSIGLVMTNPGVRITEAASENLRRRAELVRANGMSALLPAVTDAAFFGRPEDKIRRSFEMRFLRQNPEGYALSALGACNADIAPELSKITCPVLLVAGANDRLMPSAHADEIAAAIPGVTLERFADGAHFIPYQQPEEFAATVSAFLDRHALRGRR